MRKNCKKQIKKRLRIEKVIKRKGDKLYDKWKIYDNSLIVGLIKKTLNEIPLYKNESILS